MLCSNTKELPETALLIFQCESLKKESVMKDKKLLGYYGEELAAGMLYAQGYDILERNYRCRFGEADIICRNNEELFVVEVKTRTSLYQSKRRFRTKRENQQCEPIDRENKAKTGGHRHRAAQRVSQENPDRDDRPIAAPSDRAADPQRKNSRNPPPLPAVFRQHLAGRFPIPEIRRIEKPLSRLANRFCLQR